MKKLGIVLPTYNRCVYVKESIENLLPQLLNNRGDVCLLVSDNASPDETEKLIRPYADNYPDIVEYVRQKENIGSHANFYFGIKHIEAEFVYLLGDDDIVSPFFVSTILYLLKYNPNVGMIHFNYLEGPNDLKIVKVHNSTVTEHCLCKNYQNGKQFVKDVLISPSFMSSDIFRKECMIKGLNTNYHKDCYGYDWLVCLYTGIMDKPCIYYELPLVVQRYGGLYQNFALNTIVGQHKVFEYISEMIPDILLLWKEKVKSQDSWNAIAVIKTIPHDREYYKQWYEEMKKCLGSKWQIFNLSIAVKIPACFSKPWFVVVDFFNKLLLYKRS